MKVKKTLAITLGSVAHDTGYGSDEYNSSSEETRNPERDVDSWR